VSESAIGMMCWLSEKEGAGRPHGCEYVNCGCACHFHPVTTCGCPACVALRAQGWENVDRT
jgi:hypothetical protein